MAPDTSDAESAGHFMHSVREKEEYVPGPHVTQTETFVAPSVSDAVPPGHHVHWPAAAEEYVPASHVRQLAYPFMANVPGPHVMQVETDVAPVVADAEPAGHWVQSLAPSEEYPPVEHDMQSDPTRREPAGHGKQSSTDVLLIPTVYIPSPQLSQAPLPPPEYVPRRHHLHSSAQTPPEHSVTYPLAEYRYPTYLVVHVSPTHGGT
jgi:hypothetical protein